MSIFTSRSKPIGALAFFVALPFVAAVTLAGCASPVLDPSAPLPDTVSCTQLAKEMGGVKMARTQAVAKQRDPWTFVIPFAVEGRHVASPKAVDDADRSLASLDVRARLQGCEILDERPATPRGVLS